MHTIRGAHAEPAAQSGRATAGLASCTVKRTHAAASPWMHQAYTASTHRPIKRESQLTSAAAGAAAAPWRISTRAAATATATQPCKGNAARLRLPACVGASLPLVAVVCTPSAAERLGDCSSCKHQTRNTHLPLWRPFQRSSHALPPPLQARFLGQQPAS